MFAFGAAAYFMPQTTINVCNRALDPVWDRQDRMKYVQCARSLVFEKPRELKQDVSKTVQQSLKQAESAVAASLKDIQQSLTFKDGKGKQE